jgi:hypothetical protein
MSRHLRFNLSTVAVAVALAAGYAYADQESEVNQPVDRANFVNTVTGKLTMDAAIGTTDPAAQRVDDRDFFQFSAKKGNDIQVDIDGGSGGVRPVDTNIMVFGPKTDDEESYKIVGQSYDSTSVDEGSVDTKDPRIDKITIEKDGIYTVVVTGTPQKPVNISEVSYSYRLPFNGDYTLIVSGMTPTTKTISIDIRPSSSKTNAKDWVPLNPKSKGKIPVALLSSDDFDPSTINTASLTFGETGDEKSLSFCNHGQHDFNKDGHADLVCHFNVQQGGFNENSTMGVINGKTVDGTAFTGNGVLKAGQ